MGGLHHSLAGTNGIPLPSERAYVRVRTDVDEAGNLVIREIIWIMGETRRIPVTTCVERRRVGRADWGNLVRSWDVTIGRFKQRRVVYWERGRWFVRRRREVRRHLEDALALLAVLPF